jgi:hypothetical protein
MVKSLPRRLPWMASVALRCPLDNVSTASLYVQNAKPSAEHPIQGKKLVL